MKGRLLRALRLRPTCLRGVGAASLVGIAPVQMRLAVLLHVVFAGEILAAVWTDGRFLARVLLCVTRCVAGRGEGIGAIVLFCERAWVLALFCSGILCS